MIPKIFKSDAVAFEQGNGFSRVVECNVLQELGSTGVYELNMKVIADDPLFDFIQVGNIIATYPNLTDPIQGFVIEEISKPIDNVVSVYATHIAQHRAKLIPVAPVNAIDLQSAITSIGTNSLETNPFTLHSERTVSTAYKTDVPRSFRSILGGEEGSLLDVYGGEYIFNNFDIELVNRRGRDNGVQIVYGQNMTEFNLDEEFSWDKTVTGILPYWYTEDEGLVQGSIQYSDYVDYFKYHKTIAKDYSDEFEEKPTAAQLNAKALSDVQTLGFPNSNIKVAFNLYEDTVKNQVKIMQLGDTVRVINSNYNIDLTSRIVSMDFNVLSEEYNKIEIGQLQLSINEAIRMGI